MRSPWARSWCRCSSNRKFQRPRRPFCGENRTAVRIGDEACDGPGVPNTAYTLGMVPGVIVRGAHMVVGAVLIARRCRPHDRSGTTNYQIVEKHLGDTNVSPAAIRAEAPVLRL